MKSLLRILAMALGLAVLVVSPTNGQTPLSTEFTYQGRLQDNGQPANGLYDLRFKLFDAENGGTQRGGTLQYSDVLVESGLFTLELDFGPNVFDNSKLWLEVIVGQTILSPRQKITGSPHATQTRGLFVEGDGGPPFMRLGIGRAAPNSAKFNVYSSPASGSDGIQVETDAGGRPTYYYKSGNNQSVYHYLDFDAQAWRLYNAGERIFVDATGFVGINKDIKAVPTESFGVYEPTSGFAGILMETDAGGEPFYGYANEGSLNCYHYYDGDTQNWILRFPGVNALVVDPTGALEIASASARKPGGGSWATSSDRRLKKNINHLEGSLKKLLKLRGVTYEYLDPQAINELDGVRTGFIAQDVEQVFPDWVDEQPDGYKAITIRGFEAIAVEAIRELRDEKEDQIAALETRNDELQQANDELQHRLETLEQQVQQFLATYSQPQN